MLRYLARQAPGGVLTTDALGIRVPALTDDPAWAGNSNWTPDPAVGPNEADWLFGVYHRTPAQPCIAALFIADTGAAA